VLTEIERLWNAKPRPAEHVKLEVLDTLVEAYEREPVRTGAPEPCLRHSLSHGATWADAKRSAPSLRHP